MVGKYGVVVENDTSWSQGSSHHSALGKRFCGRNCALAIWTLLTAEGSAGDSAVAAGMECLLCNASGRYSRASSYLSIHIM